MEEGKIKSVLNNICDRKTYQHSIKYSSHSFYFVLHSSVTGTCDVTSSVLVQADILDQKTPATSVSSFPVGV